MASSSTKTPSSSPCPREDMTSDEFYSLFYIECESDEEIMQTKVLELFNLQATEDNTNLIGAKMKDFIIKRKIQFDEWKNRRTLESHKKKFSKIVLQKAEFPDKKPALVERPKTPKRTTRDFSEVGARQKRRKLADLNALLDNFSTENDIEINKIIGYLLYQKNHLTNKYLARLGSELYETGNIVENSRTKLDFDRTLALKTHINLSRNDIDFLKGFFGDSIHIPNREYIRQHSQKLLPEVEECRSGRGIAVKTVTDTVNITVKRLLEQCDTVKIPLPSQLVYRQKTGHDGAGGQSVYKSQQNPMSDPNIFSKMIVPLSLSDSRTGEYLWKNPTPNSAFWTRPVALLAEKESADLIKFVNEKFEPEEQSFRENGIVVAHNGLMYQVDVIIESSMKDLKIRMVESGLGGAECLMCYTQQGDWKNIQKIEEENFFAITRSADKTLELYEEFMEEKGSIVRKRNDYEERAGLTTQPLSTSDHHYLTLTHQYINGTSWFLKLFYRLKANLLLWTVRGSEGQDKLNKAKKDILKHIEEITGLRLDQVDSSGGTSTNGPQGRRFFSPELRSNIIDSLPSIYKSKMNTLMQLYSVILRAVSSTQLLIVDELRSLTRKFALFLAKEFTWVDYNITVHNLIFHSAELVEWNNGTGLGELSEEALESSNKDVRNYREFLARKCGHIPNLIDVFNRLFIRSDPVLREIISQSQSKKGKRVSSLSTSASSTVNEDEILLSKLLS